MRVTVEDGAGRVVIDGGPDDDPDGETVAKSWAAYNAAHPHHGGHKKKLPPKPDPGAFARAQQTLADEAAGKTVSAADLKNAHAVHEAHLAHLAHEKAEQEAEAGGARPAAAPAPAAPGPGGRPAGSPAAVAAAKAAGPQRYCLGIAYQAGPAASIARGQDGGRDFLDAADLEKSAWEFLANGPRVGMFHLDGTETTGDGEATATVVESYIYRPDQPWDLGNGIVVSKGDWLLGAILSPRAWDMYQRGLITGWSPQGLARRHAARPA